MKHKKAPRRKAASRSSSIEALESRLLLVANIHITGVHYAPGFNVMLEGVPNFDWSILNYNDVDADYPDNQSGGPCLDFRGVPYCYDGHNGWDILVANWRLGYQGWNIYAAAPGTVN